MATIEEQKALDQIDDAFVRRAVRTSMHLRRYMPFYVFSLIWALMLAIFPTVSGFGGEDAGSVVAGTGAVGSDATGGTLGSDGTRVTSGDDATAGAGSGATSGASGGSARRTGTQAAAGVPSGGVTGGGEEGAPPVVSTEESINAAFDASGVARSGLECAPGVRQIPFSTYATQCTRAYEGQNSGATYRGVTEEEITIVRRVFPDSANSQAADQIQEQAGFASDEVADQVRDVFIEYFKGAYELYGRNVNIIEYESENGDSTEEAQSRGREGACADATKIAEEFNAFGVTGGSSPFSECAAERGLVVFGGAAYFPEVFYQERHPFIWHRTMECERIAHQVAEYIGKRLSGKNATWAGDPLYQQQQRTFGVYVPDNDGYQHCVDIYENDLEQIYGDKTSSRYNYQLDLSRFPDQAAQAAVQFKADGITSLVLACDPYSVIFLTQAAARQEWRPEWLLIGVAATDTDNLARLYDQSEVDGHLFGMSQLGPTEKLIGPDSEPGRVYKHITGKEIPEGTTGSYFTYVQIFNFLQAAGPTLTPDTIALGARQLPPGGAPDFPAGYWSYADGPTGEAGAGDHTAIDDSREIYWDGQAIGPDGEEGTYIETYNGQRFRNGEWPQEDPPIYPNQ